MKIWLIQAKKNGVWQGWNNVIYYDEGEARRLYKAHTETKQDSWMMMPGTRLRLVTVELPVTVIETQEA